MMIVVVPFIYKGMSTGSIVAVLVVAMVVLIVALVYTSMSSTAITAIASDYTKDENLVTAHRYLVWISTIGWIAVIGIIIGVIVLFTEGEELFLTGSGSTILNLILFLVVIIIIATGVLASLAASSIGKSPLYSAKTLDPNLVKAYDDAVVGAVASLGTLIFVLVCVGIYYYSERPRPRPPPPRPREELPPPPLPPRYHAYPPMGNHPLSPPPREAVMRSSVRY